MVEIKTAIQDGIYFIKIEGEIDAGSSIHLDNAFKRFKAEGYSKIAGDLSSMKYISSAGLGVFISHLDEFKSQNIRMVLFGMQPTVREVFNILGLEKILTIVDTKDESIKKLNEL